MLYTPSTAITERSRLAADALVYGLPVVMNYAVMYEYAIDRNSGQFKAPFNQIFNEARVFTYKDTAIITPNSDTPSPPGKAPLKPLFRTAAALTCLV